MRLALVELLVRRSARGVSCPVPRSIPHGESRGRVPDRLALCTALLSALPSLRHVTASSRGMHVGCGESRRSVITRLVPHGADRARRVESPRRRHAESLLPLRAHGRTYNWPTPSPTSTAPMTAKTTVMMVSFLCTSQVRAVWSGPVMRSGFTTNARVGAMTERHAITV